MIRISIIIPCYNAAEFIEETIQSILSQNYENLECIVIDGESNDGTLNILEKYKDKIIIKSGKDRGQSDAINKGLRLATGDIVAYINADDIYEKGCFQKVANFFERNQNVKWVHGKCKIIDENNLEIRRLITWFGIFWQRRYSYNKLLAMDFIPQPAVFWRGELIDEIGSFDANEHLVMDYEYWLRSGARYNPGFIDEYLASWRVHPHSKSTMNFSKQAMEGLNVAKKYAGSKGFIIPIQYLVSLSIILVYSVLGFTSNVKHLAGKLLQVSQ